MKQSIEHDKRSHKNTICIACGVSSLAISKNGPTTFDLDEVMKRWSAVGAKFDEKTIARYSQQRFGPIRLYKCVTCGFGAYLPIVAGDSDFYGAIGHINYYNAEKWEFDRSIAYVKSKRAHSVIDVGCGSGFFLNKLRSDAPSIQAIGIEINEDAAAEARSQGHLVEIVDWQSETFRTNGSLKADVVVCHQVLEHVNDPSRLLKMIHSMVKPSGIAIISTPNSDGIVGLEVDALTEMPPHHVTKWCEGAFRAALPRAGFSIADIEYEPLSQNLWGGYFPAVWSSNKWPALLGRAAARLTNLPGEGMNWIADILSRRGIKYVYGVGGHTIFVIARPVQ